MKVSMLAALAAVVVGVLGLNAAARAATGGSFYTSQLSSIAAGNTSFGSYIGGVPVASPTATGYSVFADGNGTHPLTDAIDLKGGSWSESQAEILSTANQASFMEWDMPSGTFKAQTVFAYRSPFSGFTTDSPWHLEMFNSVTAAWQTIGVSGAGAHNLSTIAMGTPNITGTKIRAIFDSLNSPGGIYMSMGEMLVLPDHMEKVTNSYTASASSQFNPSYGAANAIDFQESSESPRAGWLSANDPNAWLTLTFASPTTLNALLLSKNSFYSSAVVDIYVNGGAGDGSITGTKVAGNVDLSTIGNLSNFNVFKFDSNLTNVNFLTVKFISGGSTDGLQGLAEVTPLFIPEPASLAMLALGGVMLLKRRRA